MKNKWEYKFIREITDENYIISEDTISFIHYLMNFLITKREYDMTLLKYDKDYSYQQIAEIYNLCSTRVSYILRIKVGKKLSAYLYKYDNIEQYENHIKEIKIQKEKQEFERLTVEKLFPNGPYNSFTTLCFRILYKSGIQTIYDIDRLRQYTKEDLHKLRRLGDKGVENVMNNSLYNRKFEKVGLYVHKSNG